MTAQNDKNSDNHPSDFSIEHILNKAGSSKSSACDNSSGSLTSDTFSWLQCTRYCPPKIPRSQKREGPQKRQLGRHPRIPFTTHQLAVLEEKFQQSAYLSSEEVIRLSRQLQLADVRVKIWFQNRRARERREKSQQSTNNEVPQIKVETNTANTSVINASLFNFYPPHAVESYLMTATNPIQYDSDNANR